ncbi:dienelactone hydrolase family protein [Thalassotalea atypica]|uniref:dienelactone hydrolase family protein n=1 Tax=Thalassotalea atypica TaxID=2054316 RepID=UPI0025740C64|nr:dienelactone hydrolase family protein [Thalassotalea atypica]
MSKQIALLCGMLLFTMKVVADTQQPYIYYVNFPVTLLESEITVSAQYRLPRNIEEPMPAVVILHSSGGIDRTGKFYARKLNRAGIATLELDMWAARGLLGGTQNRPSSVQETIPDAFAALAYLANKPEIDSERIAVLGFSWGGVVSLLSATQQYAPANDFPYQFAAHIAHYPVCWAYNFLPGFELNNLTGAPVLIQAAEFDDYDLPDTCENLVDSLSNEDREYVSLNMYKNAYHAWDRLEQELVVDDIFAHLGQGGSVTLSPNRKQAFKSRKKVLKFLKAAFEQ